MRAVMHRMSLSEIIVPYGDPRAPFNRKCAYDVVDYGMGNCCSSLDLGCDCLGVIKYFNAVLCNKKGQPFRFPLYSGVRLTRNAIAQTIRGEEWLAPGSGCSHSSQGAYCICAKTSPDTLDVGEPVIVEKAVCMHEEDTGTAWKHVEYRSGRNDMRRGRRLALQFVATVANYDYIFCTVSCLFRKQQLA